MYLVTRIDELALQTLERLSPGIMWASKILNQNTHPEHPGAHLGLNTLPATYPRGQSSRSAVRRYVLRHELWFLLYV